MGGRFVFGYLPLLVWLPAAMGRRDSGAAVDYPAIQRHFWRLSPDQPLLNGLCPSPRHRGGRKVQSEYRANDGNLCTPAERAAINAAGRSLISPAFYKAAAIRGRRQEARARVDQASPVMMRHHRGTLLRK